MILFISLVVQAQSPTIGLVNNSGNPSDGYVLFSPEGNKQVYLIDNCGEKVNEWTFSERPGLTCYLLPDGSLLRAGRDSLERRAWNNDLLWSFDMTSIGENQHHDIEPLPNGNVLCLLFDYYSNAEAINAGRDSSFMDELRLDKIIELQPQGTNDANVVWEWKFIDHLVQDFDNTKANFGVVANRPELLDINYASYSWEDHTHCNSIDYNATLDQILLSARHTNEIYIIDHTTTTAEAASHSGGHYGKGGDFLWRWGNPEVYDAGTAADQKLFKQHDATWVDNGFLDDGKISVFNNDGVDGAGTESSIHLLDPMDAGGVYPMNAGVFEPTDFDWTWFGSVMGETVYQGKKSGVQILENGNALMVETSNGRISEISKTGEVEWVYVNPHGDLYSNQYDLGTENTVFRAHRYRPQYTGFDGQTLTPIGIVEDINLLSDTCAMPINVEELSAETIIISPNPANQYVEISGGKNLNTICFYDELGKLIFETKNPLISLNNIESGVYTVRINTDERTVLKRVAVQK